MTLFHMLLSSCGSCLTRCPDDKVVLVKCVNPRAGSLISSANTLCSPLLQRLFIARRIMADVGMKITQLLLLWYYIPKLIVVVVGR